MNIIVQITDFLLPRAEHVHGTEKRLLFCTRYAILQLLPDIKCKLRERYG